MSNNYSKFTTKEFNSLPRNADGDILPLHKHFLRLTTEQVELLSEDDSSRYFEYQQELEYDLASLKHMFGI